MLHLQGLEKILNTCTAFRPHAVEFKGLVYFIPDMMWLVLIVPCVVSNVDWKPIGKSGILLSKALRLAVETEETVRKVFRKFVQV